jgi:hypothetical protein
MLAALQLLMQMLQQVAAAQPQSPAGGTQVTPVVDPTQTGTPTDTATQDANAAAPTDAASGTDNTQPLLSPDALAALLAFMQAMKQGLTATANTPSSAAATTDAASSTAAVADPSTVNAQALAAMKDLLNALRGLDADKMPDDASAPANAQATAPGTGTFDVSALLTTGSAKTDSSGIAPPLADNGTASTQAVLGQLNDRLTNLYNALAGSAGFAPMTDGAGGKDSGMMDMNARQGNASWNMATANAVPNDAGAAATPLAGDAVKASNPYNFASQLSATRATTGGAAGLPAAVEQVILYLNRNAKSGNDQMTLQLQPADLGRIDIKLTLSQDGKVQGTVMAQNPVTLDMLQKDSASLERALQDAGLRADSGSLQFSLGGQQNQTPWQGAGNANNGNAASAAAAPMIDIAADGVTTSTESWVITPGRVNLKV